MLDFSKTFEKYETLVGEVDRVFNTVKDRYSDSVQCKLGCCDCCHAVFDVTLVEAAYINYHVNRLQDRKDRRAIMKRAEKADRKYYQIKKKLQKMYFHEGISQEKIFDQLALERVACPLLNDDNQCDVYEHRPITCRVYGIPTSIGGMAHICEKATFEDGEAYPTINLDIMNDRLFALSQELLQEVEAKNQKLHMSLVPPSAAVMMAYDRDFFDKVSQEEK